MQFVLSLLPSFNWQEAPSGTHMGGRIFGRKQRDVEGIESRTPISAGYCIQSPHQILKTVDNREHYIVVLLYMIVSSYEKKIVIWREVCPGGSASWEWEPSEKLPQKLKIWKFSMGKQKIRKFCGRLPFPGCIAPHSDQDTKISKLRIVSRKEFRI